MEGESRPGLPARRRALLSEQRSRRGPTGDPQCARLPAPFGPYGARAPSAPGRARVPWKTFVHPKGADAPMSAEVKLVDNAGVRIATPGAVVYVDAFHSLGDADARTQAVTKDGRADLILVTHAHGDHFAPRLVVEAAERTGATIVGPRSVAERLQGRLPDNRLCEMEPPAAPPGAQALSVSREFPVGRVTAYRTFHSRDHTSYLVELDGFRFFHDGDNEDTRRLDAGALGRLDVLLIGPWLGGGWVEFIEKLAPRRYVLIHLDEGEHRRHDEGKYLPELCDHVPAGLTVLRPGEALYLD